MVGENAAMITERSLSDGLVTLGRSHSEQTPAECHVASMNDTLPEFLSEYLYSFLIEDDKHKVKVSSHPFLLIYTIGLSMENQRRSMEFDPWIHALMRIYFPWMRINENGMEVDGNRFSLIWIHGSSTRPFIIKRSSVHRFPNKFVLTFYSIS